MIIRRYIPYLVTIVGLALILASGCNKGIESAPDQPAPPPQNLNYKYLTLKVTCGPTSKPWIFDIAVYDQVSGTRKVLGGTDTNGNFITPNRMDATREYRVEIYYLPDLECAMAFWGVSLSTTPGLWTDDPNALPTLSAHVGSCSPTDNQGCWGP